MIKDGILVHIKEFLGHCFMAVLAATKPCWPQAVNPLGQASGL